MAKTAINDDEREALAGLPLRARVLYVFGLRWWMDYATGVVGVTRGISIQMLVELLEVDARYSAKNRPECVTTKMVRVSLEQLCRAGLVERLPGRRVSERVEALVFRLILADADSSVSNSQGTPRAHPGHTSEGTAKPSVGAGCGDSQGTPRAHPGHTSEGTPPVSGIRTEYFSSSAVDVESVGVDAAHVPTTRAWWFRFFAQRGFGHRQVHALSVGRMIDEWVRDGVAVGVVLRAMEYAHGRSGAPPGSPAFYAWAVREVLSGEMRGDGNGQQGRAGGRESAADRARRVADEYLRARGIDDADDRAIDGEAVDDDGRDVSGALG